MKRYDTLFKEAEPAVTFKYQVITYGGHVEKEDDFYNDRTDDYLEASEIEDVIQEDFTSNMDKKKGLAQYIDDYHKFIYGKILSIPAPKVVEEGGAYSGKFHLVLDGNY